MPGPWNDATDCQLLLTIIHLTVPQLPKWDKVAELMGDGYTAESTRQHFQKLRKTTKEKFGEPSISPKKGTPAKVNGTPGKSASKRKAKKDLEVERDDEEGSPSKKMKSEEDFELA